MSDDEDVLFDDAVVLFGAEEPYDLEAAVNATIAAVSAIVIEGAKSKAEACARTQEVLLIAAVALAHANGLDEEQFGDLIVTSWDRYEADAGELN